MTPPQFTGNIKVWADQLVAYLQSQVQAKQRVTPQSVLLAAQVASQPTSAAVSGLLMFDPVKKAVVVSIDGSWVPISRGTGWGGYFNTAAAQVLVANTKVTLTNNAATVIETQKPVDVATFYNGSVIPGRNGDGIAIGIEFTFTPSSALASMMSVAIDIGGAVGELYLHEYPVLRGAGVAHKVSYNITAYMLDTWQTNGGAVKVLADGPGSVTAVRYVVQRFHKAT